MGLKCILVAPDLDQNCCNLPESSQPHCIKPDGNKKCHKHVTNAPKGIGLAQDTFEER